MDRIDEQRALSIMAELPEGGLPAAYETALVALQTCANVDECKDWADKALALASYAKQANEPTLSNLATRIRARAIRREGELLRAIAAQSGQRTDIEPRGPDHPRLTRSQAAADAGLSDHQRKQALRVANVPLEEFENAVESDHPPTVTALARQGTRPAPKPLIDLGTRTPEQFSAATDLIGGIEDLFNHAHEADLPLAIAGLSDDERMDVLEQANTVFVWLRSLLEALHA